MDGAQAASLASLPFAQELEVVARSAKMPTAVVSSVGKRLPEPRRKEVEQALLAMSSDPKGIEALRTIRMVRFAPLDSKALDAATAAWNGPTK
jgi:ABC-type phosphate/phosphonate transport system substrate-binding protein